MAKNDKKAILGLPSYTPSRLLNEVLERLGARSDSKMAEMLDVYPSVIYRLRAKEEPLTAGTMLAIMEATGMSVREVRRLAGLPTPVSLCVSPPAPAGYFRRTEIMDGDRRVPTIREVYPEFKDDREVFPLYEEPPTMADLREEVARLQRENLELSERLAEYAREMDDDGK